MLMGIGAALGISTLVGCGAAIAPPRDRVATTVTIVSNAGTVGAFTPRVITVRAGQSVGWVNETPAQHDVVFDDPPGAASKVMTNKDRFAKRFTAPGTYRYVCEFHSGMEGTVLVTR